MMRAVQDVVAGADPVSAVLEAHDRGELISLRTSGTTGRPRSVVRSTASWIDSFPHFSRLAELDSHSRVWLPGPLSATMNLFAAVHARFVGAALADDAQHATHAHLTPATLMSTLQQGIDLSGVHVVVAGDRLSPELAERGRSRGARISHYYGAAELSFVAWGSHEDELRPFPGVEVQGRDGVLWVRSPYLSRGYDSAGGPFRMTDDGFATVGDRGSLESGSVRVAGRGAEVILTGGSTVLVADVEQMLRRGGCADVIVVGVPHARLGQIVAAVVADPVQVERLRALARTELSIDQRPRLWLHLSEWPVTASGKVDRAAVAAWAASGRLPPAPMAPMAPRWRPPVGS